MGFSSSTTTKRRGGRGSSDEESTLDRMASYVARPRLGNASSAYSKALLHPHSVHATYATSIVLFGTARWLAGRTKAGLSGSACRRADAMLSLIHVGAALGIGGIEAPTKFHARSLSTTAAMDVGRHVFSALNRFEIIMSVARMCYAVDWHQLQRAGAKGIKSLMCALVGFPKSGAMRGSLTNGRSTGVDLSDLSRAASAAKGTVSRFISATAGGGHGPLALQVVPDVLLAVQSFVLLPRLNNRARATMEGRSGSRGDRLQGLILHAAYFAVEAGKISWLVHHAWRLLGRQVVLEL